MPAGFILIDKESGWTSHDVVAKVRGSVGGKVGHAGTLDPMATGLLVLAVGGATRLLRFVQASRKEYIATAMFGVATDSLDADGAVLSREPMPVTQDQMEAVLDRFLGDIVQVPPMVSARKVEGKRLYELAREGQVVEREARPVTIDELEIIDFAPSDYPEVTFRIVCSTGTYIRTLGDDIARALGGRAHLTALRRTRNGSMDVADAVTVAAVAEAVDKGHVDELIIEASIALGGFELLTVDQPTAFRVHNGRPVAIEPSMDVGDGAYVRVADDAGSLIAVYRRDGEQLLPEVVLA
jgi:tRNA pseudouridine55 synthase